MRTLKDTSFLKLIHWRCICSNLSLKWLFSICPKTKTMSLGTFLRKERLSLPRKRKLKSLSPTPDESLYHILIFFERKLQFNSSWIKLTNFTNSEDNGISLKVLALLKSACDVQILNSFINCSFTALFFRCNGSALALVTNEPNNVSNSCLLLRFLLIKAVTFCRFVDCASFVLLNSAFFAETFAASESLFV